VVLALAWIGLSEDFVAVPGFVVVSLSFLAEHVPDVVRVIPLELVSIAFLHELTLPELHCFFHCEAQAFEEKTKLKPSKMLEVVVILESCKQHLHARREALSRVKVEVGESDLVGVFRGSNLL